MSQRKQIKSHNFILSLFRRIRILCQRMTRNLTRSLLRSLMLINRQDRYGRAGFVLPTVTMVLLVVVLLSITIMLRSMDRAKMAQYRRVDEQVLQAATPALDRAKAKITRLLQEDYEGGTPSDDELLIKLKRPDAAGTGFFYRLPDEERLTVKYKTNTIENAWRFPVDTNNDGKFDSYSLYGVYFSSAQGGQERSPLNARSGPMPPIASLTDAKCSKFIAASSGIESDLWPRVGANLKKAFFVYTTTVPITDVTGLSPANKYEKFKGTPGYSALEYQRDENRVPLTNNAVVYDDDLIITPGPVFRLNGRIVTNSNLVATPVDGKTATLYLVSGKTSCFYNEENSKIVVGGNVINGNPEGSTQGDVGVHLYKGKGNDPDATAEISATNQSITNAASVGIYNSEKQATLLNNLVQQQIKNAAGTDPKSVQEAISGGKDREVALTSYFKERTRKIPYSDTNSLDSPLLIGSSGDNLRANDIWMLPASKTGNSTTGLTLNKTQLEATDFATQSEQGIETYLGDRVVIGNNLPAQYYDNKWLGKNDEFPIDSGTTKWTNDNTKDRTRKTRVQSLPDVATIGRDGFWEEAAALPPKRRFDAIGGLRVITGAGVYEDKNSFLPRPTWDNPATPAKENSTYDDPATTKVEAFPIVWPDTMPMSSSPGQKVFDNATTTPTWVDLPSPLPAASTPTIDPNTSQYAKGDLRMRATAVYHYASDFYNPDANDKTQLPIACVSSYFDPTNKTTAKNMAAFPTASDTLYDGGFGIGADGKSNNGVVYPKPTSSRPTSAATLTDGWKVTLSSNATLANQANLVFPDGRFVNEALRQALTTAPADYTLADQAAIDSTLCALDILSGAIKPVATPALPHSAIREATFLNPREVKAIEANDTSTTVDETFTLSSPLTAPQKAILGSSYNLSLEERMPLEIRVTQLDLNLLRNATIAQGVSVGPKNDSNKEYMLPYSGIIYASRDDALMDLSYRDGDATNGVDLKESQLLSPTDFKLDPTRRPNGIMLINGNYLARNDSPPNGPGDGHNDKGTPTIEDVLQEKGLTLVSNLGVYIRGNFNSHSQQEFTETFTDSWNFDNYYKNRVTVNTNFGCKKGDPRLCPAGNGDTWRPANVLSDAITLLSDEFRLGFRNEGDFDLRNNSGNLVISNTGTGYSLNGDTTIDSTTKNEADLGIDLNGNGVATDTGVKETEVTATAARQLNGFFNNNFVTNGLSSGAFDTSGDFSAATPATPLTDSDYLTNNDAEALNSSYFTNFVTPIQRRESMPEYVMEICRKLPVSACQPDDWVVGTASDKIKKANQIAIGTTVDQLLSGTTARPALDPNDRRYPRRIAFLRYKDTSTPTTAPLPSPTKVAADTTGVFNTASANKNILVLHRAAGGDATKPFRPVPLGISGTDSPTTEVAWAAGTVKYYPYAALKIDGTEYAAFGATNKPRLVANSLWYRTTSNFNNPSTTTTVDWKYTAANPLYYQKLLRTDAVQQPLLVPVLQIHATDTGPSAPFTSAGFADATQWIVPATSTTFNLVMATGDTPSRPSESNGGLQNLPRFLENWKQPTEKTTTISGSFIQLIKSNFNTASQQSLLQASLPTSLFGYANKYSARAASGRTPYFVAPAREWGFDVALLSQPPDLLAQKFTGPAEVPPDEFYQEVSRSEPWVQGLLCSRKTQGGQPAVSRNTTTSSKTVDGTDCTNYGG